MVSKSENTGFYLTIRIIHFMWIRNLTGPVNSGRYLMTTKENKAEWKDKRKKVLMANWINEASPAWTALHISRLDR